VKLSGYKNQKLLLPLPYEALTFSQSIRENRIFAFEKLVPNPAQALKVRSIAER